MQDIAASSNSQDLPIASEVMLEVGKVTVDVEIQTSRNTDIIGWPTTETWPHHLEKAITATLCKELNTNNIDNFPTSEISIVLSYNDEIRELNREYRGKDKPTNVLSFRPKLRRA
jgi:probable rRNA maturation factor